MSNVDDSKLTSTVQVRLLMVDNVLLCLQIVKMFMSHKKGKHVHLSGW